LEGDNNLRPDASIGSFKAFLWAAGFVGKEFDRETREWEANVAKQIITMLTANAGLIRRRILAELYGGPKTYAELKKAFIFAGNKELGIPQREYMATDTTLAKHLNQLRKERLISRKRSLKRFPPESIYALNPSLEKPMNTVIAIYATEDKFFQQSLDRLFFLRLRTLLITRVRKQPNFWDFYSKQESVVIAALQSRANEPMKRIIEYLEDPEKLCHDTVEEIEKILADLINVLALSLSSRVYQFRKTEDILLCKDLTLELYPHLFYVFLTLWVGSDIYALLGKDEKDLKEFAVNLIKEKFLQVKA